MSNKTDGGAFNEIARLKKEIRRLKKIEHAAWHLCESSEERVTQKEIVVSTEDFWVLSKLLPEEHPPHYV